MYQITVLHYTLQARTPTSARAQTPTARQPQTIPLATIAVREFCWERDLRKGFNSSRMQVLLLCRPLWTRSPWEKQGLREIPHAVPFGQQAQGNRVWTRKAIKAIGSQQAHGNRVSTNKPIKAIGRQQTHSNRVSQARTHMWINGAQWRPIFVARRKF